MQATGGSFVLRARDWGRGHPIIALAVVGFLGFLIGAGSASSSNTGLEGRLTSALADNRSLSSESATNAQSLQSLESENEQLVADKAELESLVQRLNAKRELPKLVGGSSDFASSLGQKYGWDLEVSYRFSTAEPGTVLDQGPSAGTMMRFDAPFHVVVAKAIPKITSLVGLEKAEALRIAKKQGYEVTVVEQVSTRKPGTVISMSPTAGSRLIPGNTITVTVAKKAPAPTTVSSSGSTSSTSTGCTPGYSPCLPPASDYDCSGGSGDGPKYTGYVTVTGLDPYGLDADGDGVGCE